MTCSHSTSHIYLSGVLYYSKAATEERRGYERLKKEAKDAFRKSKQFIADESYAQAEAELELSVAADPGKAGKLQLGIDLNPQVLVTTPR